MNKNIFFLYINIEYLNNFFIYILIIFNFLFIKFIQRK